MTARAERDGAARAGDRLSSATPDRGSSRRRPARAAWSSIPGSSTERTRRRASRAATTPCWSSAARCTPTRRAPTRGCERRRRCCASCSSGARRCSASASAGSFSPMRSGRPSRPAREPEIGWYEVELTPEGERDPVLGPLAPGFTAFGWHRYEFALPRGGTPLARSAACLQAYRLGDAAWGIQFHAEVTARGRRRLDRRRPRQGGRGPHRRRLRRAARAHPRRDRALERARPRALRALPGRGRYSGVR